MYKFLQYTVHDAMTLSPLTVAPDTTLHALEELFETHDFNGIPVLDPDGNLLGMATKYDLLRAFVMTPAAPIPRYRLIMDKPVSSIMTTNPVTVTPDLPLSRVLEYLIETQTKSFPVVNDQHRLIGIISREDVLKALHRAIDD
jgi:CBS domain-containing protein